MKKLVTLLCVVGLWLGGIGNAKAFSLDGIGEVDEEILLSLIAYVTAEGPGAELLDFTTKIAAGVERSAAGIEDNPLTDFEEEVEQRFGSLAATIVDQAFDRLVDQLGPTLLADVDPIRLPPDFDIDNGRADVASVSLPEGPFIVDIGNTHNVGDGEFARVVLGLIDYDFDDNDVEQLLNEFMTGTSGANLDFEQEMGIVGVDLLAIAPEYFTLGLDDGIFTDTLTFEGWGAEAVLAKFDLSKFPGGVQPIPEPSTMILLALGLIGLAGAGRRKFLKN